MTRQPFMKLGVVFVIAGALTGCKNQSSTTGADNTKMLDLVVLTPHGPAITEAFANAFSRWHEDNYQYPVNIKWMTHGTVECQQFIYSRFQKHPDVKGIGIDVFFGGGLPIHQDVVQHGYAQKVQVPEAILKTIPKELDGLPLYDPEGQWHGTALSGFGILYNREACAMRGIPEPKTWSDLAQPVYKGWISAADPAISGSTAECFSLILLKHGWQNGWGIVMGILANCNGLLPSSSQVGPSVQSGVAVAGLQTEFVARALVADDPRLTYINPEGATVATPDPATVIRGGPNPEVARRFIEFVLSENGQKLWALSPEEMGGPAEALYRNPIRPDIYEKYAGKLIVQSNPFADKNPWRIDIVTDAHYARLLPVLIRSAAGANHLRLQKAWAIAQSEGVNSPKLASLKAPLFEEGKVAEMAAACGQDSLRAQNLENLWANQFREKYEAVTGSTSTMPAHALR